MALPRVSGRSRTVNVVAAAMRQLTGAGTGTATAQSGWLDIGLTVPGVSSVSISGAPSGFVAAGTVFVLTATVTYGISVTLGPFGTRVGTTTWTAPADGTYFLSSSTMAAFSGTSTRRGTVTLQEWIDTDFTRYENYIAYQYRDEGRATGVVARAVIVQILGSTYNVDIPVPDIDIIGPVVSGTRAPTLFPSLSYKWSHNLTASGGLTATSSISISGPGMSCEGVDLQPSGGLSGTSTRPVLASGSATVEGEPDWAFRSAIDFRTYDGKPLSVNTLHLCGNGVTYDQVSTGHGDHRYPPNGVTAWAGYTLPGPILWENYRKLLRCGTVPGNLNAGNYIKIDPAAADVNGILFNTPIGNSIWCSFYATPPFAAATVSIAETHEFSLFEALAKWSANARLTFPGGGFLTFTNENATARQITATYTLKPYGYRYYRFQLRTRTAGSRCALILTRSTSRASTPAEVPIYGPTRTFTATYRYEFTSQRANTWETKRFDLLFPDEHTDGASFFERYPVHPELFIAGGGVVGLQVEFLDADVYELDSLTGYLRSDFGRQPRRITTHLSLNGALPSGATLETYETPSVAPDLLYVEQNNVHSRMLVNGARGFWMGRTVGLTNQTVNAVWNTNIRGVYDTAANDTGITIALDGGLFPTEVPFINSCLGGESLVEEVDGTYTAYHQHRQNGGFGYYGMGDPLGTGEYGAEIVLRGRKWLQGIVQGVLYNETRPVRGVKLEVRQQPDGAYLNRATSDADGYYGMAAPYGVVRPYSNLPISSNWNDRKQFTESGGVLTYTATGRRFAPHWLYGKRLVEQDGEHYAEDAAVRRKIVVVERYPSWYDWEANFGPAPSNLATDWGFYFEVDTRAEGGIECRRARLWLELDLTATVTPDAQAEHPHVYRDYRERLWCLWHTPDGVWRAYSDDDGETWSDGVMSIADAWYPRAAVDPQSGIILETAYRDGAIVGRLQYPGDAEPRAVFAVTGFDVEPADTPHDVVWDYSSQRRVIYVLSDGEASTRYESFDDGETVRRVG